MPLFTVDSKDRDTNYVDGIAPTSSAFHIPLDYDLNLHKVIAVKLKRVILPNTIYNIRAGVNDLISWTSAGVGKTATIPAGSWTLVNLMAGIVTLMNAADGTNTYTVAVNNTSTSSSQKVVFTRATGANTFVLSYTASRFPTYELGFQSGVTAGTNVYTGGCFPNVMTPYSLGIRVREFGKDYVRGTADNRGFTFLVPVDVNSGDVINFYPDDDGIYQGLFFSSPVDVRELTVTVHLPDGTAADLNGVEWQMIWEITLL